MSIKRDVLNYHTEKVTPCLFLEEEVGQRQWQNHACEREDYEFLMRD